MGFFLFLNRVFDQPMRDKKLDHKGSDDERNAEGNKNGEKKGKIHKLNGKANNMEKADGGKDGKHQRKDN